MRGAEAGDRAIVIYDRDCGFCRWSADRIRAWDRHSRLRFVPLQAAEADTLLHEVPPERRSASWHVVETDGRVWSAGAALPRLLRMLPGGAPIAVLAEAAPGLTDLAYTTVARRRGALGRLLGQQTCSVDPSDDAR